jgi:dihydrofolate reductase
MALPDRIEGLAIVSTDGMLANAQGIQPDELKLEADQRFFHGTLARASAVVHGRHSSEGTSPEALQRPRLILSRRVPSISRDPANDKIVHWNPAGASFEEAWVALGVSGGLLAVIGGTDVFGLFLESGYDAFHLTRAAHATLPGGRPVFPGVPARTPEALLAAHGLKADAPEVLDASAGVTLVTWHP